MDPEATQPIHLFNPSDEEIDAALDLFFSLTQSYPSPNVSLTA